ncbi:MAG: hypothetical protein WC054_01425 [Candidatus Nanopelagicales bacterium]
MTNTTNAPAALSLTIAAESTTMTNVLRDEVLPLIVAGSVSVAPVAPAPSETMRVVVVTADAPDAAAVLARLRSAIAYPRYYSMANGMLMLGGVVPA